MGDSMQPASSVDVTELSCTVNVPRQTGIFTFRIGGFPALDDKVGDTTESPEFDLCRRKWQLRIFPGGSLASHAGYISYYLASKSLVQTRASYKLVIVNQLGRPDEVFQSQGIRKFEAKGESVDGWGRDKFIERSKVLSAREGLCVDDTVIFRVEVTVYGVCGGNVPHVTMFDKHGHRLLDDFSRALDDTSYSDVVIHAGSGVTAEVESIKAHRFVLCARSPVFRAMFTRGMLEDKDGVVTISDVEPHTMWDLLKFMYTEKCSDSSIIDDTASLLAAATKYQVDGLVDYCEEVLCASMTVDTACDLLMLAETYRALELKDNCIRFIIQNANDIMLKGTIADLDYALRQEVLKSIQDALSSNASLSVDDGLKKHNGCCIL